MSVSKVSLDSQNSIEYQPTPWDKRIFGKPTIEILNIQFDSEDKGALLLKEFQIKEKPGMSYGRFKSSNFSVKNLLSKNGYIICEYAADLFLPKLNEFETPPLYKNRILPIKVGGSSDHDFVRELAGSMFDFSRFHEDPFIDEHLANKRMQFWVDDLINQKKKFFIYRDDNGELISFVFCEEKNGKVDLILGGSKKKKGMLSPFFFSSVVDHYSKTKIKSIQARVSLANLGMLRLYLSLGFNIKQTFIDYHMHYKLNTYQQNN